MGFMRDSSPLFSFLFFVFLSVAVTKNHSGFLTRITWFSDPTWFKVWILNFNQIIGLFRSNSFFFKLKRCYFSKKKLTSCNRVFDWVTGSTGSHQIFPFFIFSSTRSIFSPKLAGSRVTAGPGRFQNYAAEIQTYALEKFRK